MTIDCSPLFAPIQIKNKLLPNRIVMPPLVVNRGLTGKDALDWYGSHARGGAGMVIVEATDIPLFGAELTVAHMRPLVDAIHQGGALAAIQLFPGRRLSPQDPADLSLDDIRRLVDLFVEATAICGDAGFDAVQPHGAHGYLLTRFFSRRLNRRSDEYGGLALQGRMHLALEIVQAMAPLAHQTGMLLMYRHTPLQDNMGYTFDDSLFLAGELVKLGVDVLDISPSSAIVPGDLAVPFRRFGVPVIAVGRMDVPERALEVLSERRADLVAVGRGLIADQDWPKKVREGRFNDIVACTHCDQCQVDQKQGQVVGCVEWYGR